jgi:WD40 repeat protein
MADTKPSQPNEPKLAKTIETKQQQCAARFTPCGKFLIAGGFDGLVRRWDATSDEFKELPPLEGHGGWVSGLAIYGEGTRLYTADSWGRLRAWNYADAAPKPLWDIADAHNGWIRQVAVSADGKLLATCGLDKLVRVWDAATGKKLHDLTGHTFDVLSVAFHPDGKSLVSGDLTGVVKQWDVTGGKHIRDFEAKETYLYSRLQDIGGVRVMAFDAEGKTLACAGTRPKNGGNVQGTPIAVLFNWADGKPIRTLELGTGSDVYVYDLHFDPAGHIVAVTSGNPGTGKLVMQKLDAKAPFVSLSKANLHSVSRHPNGTRLAVVGTNANSSGNGRVKSKDGSQDYPGNWSPIYIFDLPQPAAMT